LHRIVTALDPPPVPPTPGAAAGASDVPAPPAQRDATAPLWKRVAAHAAIVAAVGACGGLGWYVGKVGLSKDALSPATATAVEPAAVATTPDFAGTPASADVRALADWILANGDHGRRPFAIVDKSQARVFVFGGGGRLMGAAPILLGLAVGDDSVPGIGERPVEKVLPHERTTPAGRFVAAPGRNHTGEEVVWVDYGAAVSMHSVRALVAEERRMERLASANPAEHRISYGCINLPHEFFKGVAQPAFGQAGGIVYVLPETRPWQTIVAAASR
jgi:hypothetical protein